MDFRRASSLLESVLDDLEYGFVGDARQRLGDIVRAHPEELYGYGPIHTPSRRASLSMARRVSRLSEAKKPEPFLGSKPRPKAPTRVEEPMKIKFKKILKGWKEHCEGGGEDTPEALGGFLHRHFGHKKFPHAHVMKIAMKAHGKDKDTARRVADHYMAMNKGIKPEPPSP